MKDKKKDFLDSVYKEYSPSGKKRTIKYRAGGKNVYNLSQDDLNAITKIKLEKQRARKKKNWERFKKKIREFLQ
jgi:hypothetical protein